MNSKTDVVIIGAGMAGLTLALQINKGNSNISITVLEKRNGKASESCHKVGESTVELGTYYLREVVDLKEYLIKEHLPKKGLRFFLSPENKTDITKRLEIGPKTPLPAPSHQIDRGIFENDLIDLIQQKGIKYIDNAKVKDADINKRGNHTIHYNKDKNTFSIECKWVVDASGRGFFLKKKLNLKKDLDHNISSAWFRLKGVIDVSEWSEDKIWKNQVAKGDRKLATCHLMDTGYWVWIIPLVTGNTSIGIVADEKHHPLNTYSSYTKAMDWLSKNEPQAFQKITESNFEVLDFKAVKHFSYDHKKYYSNQRWATTGEASSFLDPFYSPGTDLIAINNSFISDLILKDFNNEDIYMPTILYEITYNELIKNWAPIYQNKYLLFGNSQIMTIKIFWDWAVYWAFPCVIFINNGYTNIDTLKFLFTMEDSSFPKVAKLGINMQDFFLDWNQFETKKRIDYIDYIEMSIVEKMQIDLTKTFTQEELKILVTKNLELLEQIAITIFTKAYLEVFKTNEYININPYTFKLTDGKELLIKKSKEIEKTIIPIHIKEDLEKIW